MKSNASKEIVEALFESMREEVTQFIEEEGRISSSTEYEERLLELSRKFAAGILSQSQGNMPKSRNSKKSVDKSGSS